MTAMKAATPEQRLRMDIDSTAFAADSELIRALHARSVPVPCDTDRLLFHQDEPSVGIYILHEGEATLTMDSLSGRELFSVHVTGGSLLGLPGLVGNHPYSLSAVAHAGARVSFVSRADFNTLVQADPLLSIKILHVLAAEVRTARRALF
jgi:CRP-like cAMP-binding protein